MESEKFSIIPHRRFLYMYTGTNEGAKLTFIRNTYLLFCSVLRIRIRIHKFLGLPDPDPLVRGMDRAPDPSIIMQK